MVLSIRWLIYIFACLTLMDADAAAQAAAAGSKPRNGNLGREPAPSSPRVDTLAAAEVGRGQRATILGEFPTVDGVIVEMRRITGTAADSLPLIKCTAPCEKWTSPVSRSSDGKTLSFTVPYNIRLGRYLAYVKTGATSSPIAVSAADGSPLQVVQRGPVRITSISPPVVYPEHGTYKFTVSGEGFSLVPEDNALVVEGMPDLQLCPQSTAIEGCVKGKVINYARALEFSAVSGDQYNGALNVRARVGDQLSEGDSIPLTLSPVAEHTPLQIAAGAMVVLTALVYWLVRKKRWTSMRGPARGFFQAALLDEATNTYSLSKLQFYLWTAAAVLGYVYLSASRSLVQGIATLADVPANLPGIIFISASTSLLSVGITSAKGSKGAGDEEPSAADLVTTGGVIAPERLQFFLWTIIGVAAFVWLTFSMEPEAIQTLPSIPEGFLYLMGLSSFGYIGGKLARKPGPVITDIVARPGSLILEIHGSHLSSEASFRITDASGEHEISRSMISGSDGRPTRLVPDDAEFAKALLLTVVNLPAEWATQKWLGEDHRLTVINPDGQKAVATFNVAGSTPGTATKAPPSPPAAGSPTGAVTPPPTAPPPPPVTTTTPPPAPPAGTKAAQATGTATPPRPPASPPASAGAVTILLANESTAGKTVSGKVQLEKAAAAVTTVTLETNRADVVARPATLTIPAGDTEAAFAVVPQAGAKLGTVRITAKVGTTELSQEITFI